MATAISTSCAAAQGFNDELEQPAWFKRALEYKHVSDFVTVDGCRIHYLHWPAAVHMSLSDRDKLPPSVVFVHGTSAHAHWFHHIAPFFAEEAFDAVSISLSGFGDSGWREAYGQGVWSKEVLAVCQELGLFLPGRKAPPILVGHSLGSFVVEEAAMISECDSSGQMPIAGVVVLDGGIPHPVHWILEPQEGGSNDNRASPFRDKRTTPRQYPLSVKPVSRLRLTPHQEMPHPYILEHVANHSVKRFDAEHWTWKFDPAYSHKYDFGYMVEQIATPENVLALRRTRVAVVYGEESKIVAKKDATYMRNRLGDHISFVGIVNAGKDG